MKDNELLEGLDLVSSILRNDGKSQDVMHCGSGVFLVLKHRAGIIVPCSQFKYGGRVYVNNEELSDYDLVPEGLVEFKKKP